MANEPFSVSKSIKMSSARPREAGLVIGKVCRDLAFTRVRAAQPTHQIQLHELVIYRIRNSFATLFSKAITLHNTANMASKNLPPSFNATAQDIEMLLAAQCHIGAKNLQVHMEPYLWKTRPDGVNIINIGKTW